ncbi:MAG: hypothetical protein K1X67_08780 [Fimbriimonadaceae bacterium]|nr:hypothetical protein [Fimbriimonadaceae bacterium]
MPDVFTEKDDAELSFHLCPNNWGLPEIEEYVSGFPVPSGARLGVIVVTDEDFDAAGIVRPVPSPIEDEAFGQLHNQTPVLSDEQRAVLAKVVSRNLPGSLLVPFRRRPEQRD